MTVKFMENAFKQAEHGRKVWQNLENRNPADRYIFMPHHQEEYNDYAMLYLDEYMSRGKWGSAVILSSEKEILEKVRGYNGPYQVTPVLMTQEDIEAVLRFYALYMFSPKVTIISLTMPYDTGGENLLGIHGTTKRELLCYDIYRFDEVPGQK